jgi:hypothetical protein
MTQERITDEHLLDFLWELSKNKVTIDASDRVNAAITLSSALKAARKTQGFGTIAAGKLGEQITEVDHILRGIALDTSAPVAVRLKAALAVLG